MNKIIFFSTVLAIAVLTFSCQKEVQKSDGVKPNLSSYPSIFQIDFDYKHIVQITRIRSEDKDVLNISGSFTDNNGYLSSNASLEVNNLDIEANSQNYFWKSINFHSPDFLSVYNEHDGNDVQVNVEVLGSPENGTIYSPKDLVIMTNQDFNSVDKTQNLTITWEVDAINPNQEIALALISRGVDGDITEATRNLHHTVVTEDDGSYTISSSEISSWPDGLWLDLVIIRGNFILLDATETMVISLVHSSRIGKIVDSE